MQDEMWYKDVEDVVLSYNSENVWNYCLPPTLDNYEVKSLWISDV